MLEDTNRSADSVAQVLDFPSGSAFRNTCQRYLHCTPQQVRDNGGAAHVIDVFMREARANAPPPGAHGNRGPGAITPAGPFAPIVPPPSLQSPPSAPSPPPAPRPERASGPAGQNPA
jgi:hypothetical protein